MLSQPPNDQVEALYIMRALDPEVKDAIWAALEARLPPRAERHPLGCHRARCSDRDCFELIVVRLATGCSWEDAERLTGHKVSDTTARARRDEWIAAGIFDALSEEALFGFDKVIGLDLSEVAVDGSLQKSPCGGEGTGRNPTDRAKLGWKWSILTERNGIPIGWAVDGANRNDSVMLEPTLDNAAARGLLCDIETIWLDRGYDSDVTRQRLAARLLDDAVIAKKRKKGEAKGKNPQPMGMRWPVERTNAWFAAYGQLRRNTDRKTVHRLAQLTLAVTFMLTAKLIDYRNRWSRIPAPIG